MNNEEITLIQMYKKALKGELDINALNDEILETEKQIDSSFVKTGAEDQQLIFLLNELKLLKENICYEQ